ncbi:MAG TPA: hypothetical protein PLL69_02710 [Gemmatimonadales bacterium]|nr:hypothetical protein [Gemmatimonadales bacterium]
MKVVVLLFAVFLVWTLGGCAEDPTLPGSVDADLSMMIPMCVAGCIGPGPDPNPEAPGEWIGGEFTDDTCFAGSPDADADGMADLCEKRLIKAFRPLMISAPQGVDDVRGEWYWAARPGGTASSAVLIYLPAYYRDLGEDTFGLTGHPGDSEVIAMGVEYVANTQHWLLRIAYLSHHGDYSIHGSTPGGYPTTLSYSERVGGHPTVWAAKFKHANYPSVSECNSGGGVHTDGCMPPWSSWRFPYYEHHNVGSSSHNLKNCVEAEFDYTRLGTECLWHVDVSPYQSTFTGWDATATQGGKAYGNALTAFGF